jgi:hypothetical protein
MLREIGLRQCYRRSRNLGQKVGGNNLLVNLFTQQRRHERKFYEFGHPVSLEAPVFRGQAPFAKEEVLGLRVLQQGSDHEMRLE